MPCGAGISGYTSGKGASVIRPNAQFVNQCTNCDGKYPTKKIFEANFEKKESQKSPKSKKKDNW